MLILLEHYKLQLTLVLPKVCFVVRKALQKGKKKMEETQGKSKWRSLLLTVFDSLCSPKVN
jgi:hypothetical protein